MQKIHHAGRNENVWKKTTWNPHREQAAFQLMERAARHVADAAAELAGENGGTVLCLCGPGSNGGDGLAAMRLLTASHPELRAVCWLLPGTPNDAAEHQLRRLQAEAPAVEVVRLTDGPLPPLPENVRCFVDSLFGTGLSRPLTGTALALCALMNEQERIPTLAVDIPSGLDGTRAGSWAAPSGPSARSRSTGPSPACFWAAGWILPEKPMWFPSAFPQKKEPTPVMIFWSRRIFAAASAPAAI